MEGIFTGHYATAIEEMTNPEIREKCRQLNLIRQLYEARIKKPKKRLIRKRPARRYVEVMNEYRELIKEYADQNTIIWLMTCITIEMLMMIDEQDNKIFDMEDHRTDHQQFKDRVGTNTINALAALKTAELSVKSMHALMDHVNTDKGDTDT